METSPAVRGTGSAADAGWLSAPVPAVLVDVTGVVRAVNGAAGPVLPGARPGVALADCADWLDRAHRRPDAGSAHGPLGERSFEAHPARHDDGSVTWWLVDDTDVRLAREALRVEQERTAVLGEVSSALLTSLNPERCMRITAELAAGHLADAAWVVAPGSRHEHSVTWCVRGGEAVHERLPIDPRDVAGLAEALQGFPPVPSRWIEPSSAPAWLVPDGFGDVGSIVVTPLPGHGVPAGALVLLRRTEQQAFSDEEEYFARLFAARAGVAMSAARMFAQQLSITETLMRELLPPTLRAVDGVEFAGRYRPANDHERVGGDFYDVHELETGESLAVLGDVCGKGLEAAVMTGKVRSTLQALLPLAGDHRRMLELLNGALLSSHHTKFVTVVLASAARVGADVRLRVTTGGHLPPLVVRTTGEVHEVPTRGTLIGVLPEVDAVTAEVLLAPGETCLFYTDGITEAVGGPLGDEMFGEDRLRRALADCAGMPADAVTEHVHMVASQWIGGGSHDDIAVLAITAPRGRHLSAVADREATPA
ncbi:PP2C family protein-serine/threonine phosphatase [Actinosynnema sp. NPDC053489]|uniref:PP2C family protein-serine/threonine phosphatase n=1 Tax=Actinosynnema sp. NPDC053489 TaxID=3363916 RepID=UPI0037CB8F47